MKPILLAIVSILCVPMIAHAESIIVQVEGTTPKQGMILSLHRFPGIDSSVVVGLTTSRGDKAVYCVFRQILGSEKAKVKFESSKNVSGYAFRNGIVPVLVTDTGGNVDIGDLIDSSSIPGLGERQTIAADAMTSDPIVQSKTVGKALEAINFAGVEKDGNGTKKKLIYCIVR